MQRSVRGERPRRGRTGGHAAAAAGGLLAACFACAQPLVDTPSGPEIEWRSDRKLAWTDFRAPVDPQAPRLVAATTMASLKFGYGYAIERSAGLCAYRITEITSAAVFHPEASWVRPNAATAAVLAHEQGHFDLTQVHKLEFEAQTRPLLNVRHTCRYQSAVEEEVVKRVEPLREEIWQRLEAVQAQYDLETGNGTNASKQHEWSERIAAALRRGHWE